jgi:glycosyltransferase involved in cell wall biosynthesis
MNKLSFKLAIVSTHPIQYNAPLFRLLAQQNFLQLKVFYTWAQSQHGEKYDPGFDRNIEWDIPLLDGYEFEFVENISGDPGTHHFKGIDNPHLIQKIKSWEPDALLIFGWSFKSHLSCIRYFKNRIPVLFRGDSNLLDEHSGFKKLARRIFLRWVYRHIDYALYAGTNNKEYFLAHGLKETQLYFVPHAVDNERFWRDDQFFESEAKNWRNSLSIGENDFVLLFAGKLESKKNPEYILQLAGAIPDENTKFLIVGNGPLENSLKTSARNDKRIIFVDFQNQKKMPVVYRMGNAFILPSKGPGETWGLAVNEAMACGRPVIVSKKAGCAIDMVFSDRNGIIMDPGELNLSIEYLNALKKNRQKMINAGNESKKIVSTFSFSIIVKKISDFLQSELGKQMLKS